MNSLRAKRDRAGKRVFSALQALTTGAYVDPFKADDEKSRSNHRALAVYESSDEVFDNEHSEFFLSPEVEQLLSDDEMAALDAMIDRHGVKNLLLGLSKLLVSRVDESQLHNGRVIYHLSREDAYSRAAETCESAAYRVGDL